MFGRILESSYETKRLILRVCKSSEAPLIADFYKRNYDDFGLYETLFEEAKSSAFHKRSLAYESQLFRSNKYIRLYIFEKENPLKIIGTVSYRDIDKKNSSCIVGYKIDKEYRRRGYCREALLHGDSLMFDVMGLNRIEATVLPTNEASIGLLESIGYINHGTMPNQLMINNVPYTHLLFIKINMNK